MAGFEPALLASKASRLPLTIHKDNYYLAVVLGIEPRYTVSTTVALPLGDTTIFGLRDRIRTCASRFQGEPSTTDNTQR